MSQRPIVRLGHPALRQAAEPVEPAALASAEFQQLVDDLFETMRAHDGVGLAAPQVGLGLQLFVYGVEPEGDDPGIAPRVVVNPMLEAEPGPLEHDWEGCLSIPDLRGLVPRHPAVRVRALDRHGAAVQFRVEGFAARIVQHEFDHLNGVVFLDRMRDLHSLAFLDEWREFGLAGESRAGEHPE